MAAKVKFSATLVSLVVLVLGGGACAGDFEPMVDGGSDPDPEEIDAEPAPEVDAEQPADAHVDPLPQAPDPAFCQAEVNGTGVVEVETDYLPHVVNCENGGAAFEALKAQAVAARSYLYYKLENSGSINDGTGDQVYSCDREPGEEHFAAVAATSGEILRYADTQVMAFYVAGAIQDPPECIGGTDDYSGTEHYVTYNEGLSGSDIEQTTLGWADPGNYANRGCMSQNGSDCLAQAGHDYVYILHYFYGADIERWRAAGECVVEP